jgi:hypothetical protein
LLSFELDVQISPAECQLLLEKLKLLAEQDAWPGDEDYYSLIPKLERAAAPRSGFRWTRTIRAVFDNPGDTLPLRADAAAQVAHALAHREQLNAEITHRKSPDAVFADNDALDHAAEDPRYRENLRRLHQILAAAMPWRPGEHRRVPLDYGPSDP